MPISRRHFQVAVMSGALFLAPTGCTDSSAPTLTLDGGGEDAQQDSAVSDAGAPVCIANQVTSVHGNVVDQNGAPLAGARVQPCIVRGDDVWLCLAPTDAEASGAFERAFDGENACMKKLAMRVTGPITDTLRYSIAYCQAELGEAEAVNAGAVHLVPVRAPSSVDGDDAHYASGLVITVGDADGDPTSLLASVDGADIGCGSVRDGAIAIVSFAPEGIREATRIRRIPIPETIADGTSVDIFVLGGLATYRADETRVDEGELDLIGTGTAANGFLAVDLPLLYASALVLKPAS